LRQHREGPPRPLHRQVEDPLGGGRNPGGGAVVVRESGGSIPVEPNESIPTPTATPARRRRHLGRRRTHGSSAPSHQPYRSRTRPLRAMTRGSDGSQASCQVVEKTRDRWPRLGRRQLQPPQVRALAGGPTGVRRWLDQVHGGHSIVVPRWGPQRRIRRRR
jgi:hypothetical protein